MKNQPLKHVFPVFFCSPNWAKFQLLDQQTDLFSALSGTTRGLDRRATPLASSFRLPPDRCCDVAGSRLISGAGRRSNIGCQKDESNNLGKL
jgi:hypothetical protein